jgi:hypothetical protein
LSERQWRCLLRAIQTIFRWRTVCQVLVKLLTALHQLGILQSPLQMSQTTEALNSELLKCEPRRQAVLVMCGRCRPAGCRTQRRHVGRRREGRDHARPPRRGGIVGRGVGCRPRCRDSEVGNSERRTGDPAAPWLALGCAGDKPAAGGLPRAEMGISDERMYVHHFFFLCRIHCLKKVSH